MKPRSDIFIAGDLSTIGFSLVKKLLEEGHSVVVAEAPDDYHSIKNRNFTAYTTTVSENVYLEIFQSHSFDTVVYIPMQDNRFLPGETSGSHGPDISLEDTLDLCIQSGVELFVFVSSTEIYGEVEFALEDQTPEPTSKKGQLLLNAENLCRYYANSFQH